MTKIRQDFVFGGKCEVFPKEEVCSFALMACPHTLLSSGGMHLMEDPTIQTIAQKHRKSALVGGGRPRPGSTVSSFRDGACQ